MSPKSGDLTINPTSTLCVTTCTAPPLTLLFYLVHRDMVIPIVQQGKQRFMEKRWLLLDHPAEEVTELS